MPQGNNIASSINAFSVEPSRDQLINLTIGQIQDLIQEAVLEAVHSLKDELLQLKATVASQAEKIADLQATQDTQAGNQLIQLRLIRELKEASKKEPQPLQKDRSEILRALLASNGGKMLMKDARQKMRLSRSAFSQLIATMKDYIEVKPFHLRKNQKVITLKSCLVKQ